MTRERDIGADRRVVVDRDSLDTLLWFARRGDVAVSRRRWRNWFRHAPVCSGDIRSPECHSCQAFEAAEAALRHWEE